MKIQCHPNVAEICQAANGQHYLAIAPLILLAIAIVVLALSYVITSMLVKKPKTKPASLEDFDSPQTEEGTPEYVLFGDHWSEGPMILWYGNYRTKKIYAEGGK